MSHRVLHVFWRLLESCNYNCAYCLGARHDDQCVIMPERLQAIAWRILQYPASRYDITIGGGEPTLHPFLPDIVRYFRDSRYPVRLTLETNGSAGADYLRDLAIPGIALKVALGIHPRQTSMEQLPGLLMKLCSEHLLSRINLFLYEKESQRCQKFLELLRLVMREFPFQLHIIPTDGAELIPSSLQVGEADVQGRSPVSTERLVFLPPHGDMLFTEVAPVSGWISGTRWCVHGVNSLFISHAGYFRTSDCPMSLWRRPLWEINANIPPFVCKCELPVCSAANEYLPKFSSGQDAENWLGRLSLFAGQLDRTFPVLLPPGQTTPGAWELILVSLHDLKPRPQAVPGKNGKEQIKIRQNPGFLAEHQHDIIRILNVLGDKPSKEIFLRLLKCLLTGDTAYLGLISLETGHVVKRARPEPTFRGPGRYCAFIEIKGLADPASLALYRGTIRQHQPELRFAVGPQADKIIDLFTLLLELVPQYQLHLEYGMGFRIICRATIPPAVPNQGLEICSSNAVSPVVSIVIVSQNNEGTIARAIDAALVQRVADFELVILDNGSSDRTPEIVAQYVERYPAIVRYQSHDNSSDYGVAATMAMSLARGDYVAFADATGMLAEDFANVALELAKAKNAVVVATDVVLCPVDGPEKLWKVTPGTFAGEEALVKFLNEDAGPCTLYGKLFRRDFLREENVRFGDGRHAGLAFCVQAFFYASKVVIASAVGHYHYPDQPGQMAGGQFRDFCKMTGFLATFLEDQGLDAELGAACLERIYEYSRLPILEELARQEAKQSGTATEKDGDSLDACLLQLGQSRVVINLLLRDYAELLCRFRKVAPRVRQEDRDWRRAATVMELDRRYAVYGAADAPTCTVPLLSVIVPNYNKALYLRACLDSILSQSLDDFELIIVDDASTDASGDMLALYAACHHRIRFYQMLRNCRQGVCRNIGIQKARGKYLLFVDSDDIVEPGFFTHAVEVMKESRAEVGVFSLRKVRKGKQIWAGIVEKGIFGQRQFRHMYASGQFPPAPYAKIFRTDFVKISGATFEESIYHQDQFFIGRIAAAAHRIAFDPFLAYSVVESEDSSIRPATRRYLHAHSACRFYEFLAEMDDIGPEPGWQKHLIWNLENVLLLTVKAFLDADAGIPFTDADYSGLQSNKLFLRGLLRGFADFSMRHRELADFLTTSQTRAAEVYRYEARANPLASVVVAVYNQEGVMGRAMDSILKQSLRSLEVIVVDDASTDHTPDIIKAYAERDGRIRIICNPVNSGGCGYPRNVGVLASHGEFFTFVDSDDYINDFLLSGVAQLLHSPGSDFIQFAREEREGDKCKLLRDYAQWELLHDDSFFRKFMEGSTWWNAVAKLYRKDFFIANNLAIHDFLFEDNVFILEAYSKARNVIVDPMIAYVQVRTVHTASATRPIKYTPRHIRGYFASAALVSRFIREHGTELAQYNANWVRKLKQKNVWPHVLEYIASFRGAIADPLTLEDKANLNATPELCSYILEEFAALLAQRHSDFPRAVSGVGTAPDTVPAVLKSCSPIGDATLSLLILARDDPKALKACLDSALAQDIPDVEIILLDYSTTGKVAELCQRYAANQKQVRLLRSQWRTDRGTIFNLGVAESRGRYLMLLNDWERLTPAFLMRALSRMESSNCDLAMFAVGDAGRAQYTWLSARYRQLTGHETSMEFLARSPRCSPLGGFIFDSRLLKDNNIRFPAAGHCEAVLLFAAAQCATKILSWDICAVSGTTDFRPGTCNQAGFMAQVRCMQAMHDIIDRYPAAERDTLANQYFSWLLGRNRVFLSEFFGFIHGSIIEHMPQVLTDELVRKLTTIPGFVPAVLRAYAEMMQSGG